MPCTDWGFTREERAAEALEIKIARAGLCALITAMYRCSPMIKDIIISHIDWKQAGITPKQLDDWYANHRTKET